MKKYIIICIATLTNSVAMELPQESAPKKPACKQSIIEFFSNIKKEHFDILPPDLQTTILMNQWLPQVIHKPWHYVEHVIPVEAMALCFIPNNKLLLADYHTITWFDYQKGCVVDEKNYSNNYAGTKDICFDKKGQRLVMMSNHGGGHIVDVSGEKSIEIENQNVWYKVVQNICVNHDDSMIVSVLENGHIHLHDMETGSENSFKIYGYVGSLERLCFAPIASVCAVCNDKEEIIIGDGPFKGQMLIEKYCVIPKAEYVTALCFNPDATQLAVGFIGGTISIFETNKGGLLWSFFFESWTPSLCFNQSGTRIAAAGSCLIHNGCKQSCTRIIAQYDNYTIDQLLLRKLMHLWLQVKKPASHICSMKTLVHNMARLFRLYEKELIAVWASFPFLIKQAIKETMLSRIKKYQHHEAGRLKKAKKRIKRVVQ